MSLNHKEVMEALLAGKVLVDIEVPRIRMRLSGARIELWEELDKTWSNCVDDIVLTDWKLEQETITINGHVVPKPLTVTEEYPTVFLPGIDREVLYICYTGESNVAIRDYLKRGLLHSTKEAAIAHARALLSFTEED